MSQQRLEELDELVNELYVFKGIDVNSSSIVYTESEKYTENKAEHKYVYYALRNFGKRKPSETLLKQLLDDVLGK